MDQRKATYEIKKGEKFGCFNMSDNWVESHHRTITAAEKAVASRQKHWGKEKSFKVVGISA